MIPQNLTGKALEKFFFLELIKEITIRRKGKGRKFNQADREQLEVELGLSRGAVQGALGFDSSKSKGVPHPFTKDQFAKLDKAYKDFDDFVRNYRSRFENRINEDSISISEEKLVKRLLNHYNKKREFNTISILGSSDKSDGFNISDFFIDISYLDRAELISNNDFFAIEKEGFAYKNNKKTRNEIFTNYFSIEVVTERLIFRDKQVVLMGNPGVGKSTYARWLCHMWAIQRLRMESVPIYISCRELTSSHINSITAYINAVYYKGKHEDVSAFLSNPEFQYTLILDGYDEASFEQRSLLERDLDRLLEIGSYPSFALLTRPYALVDSPFKRIPTLYEFIGFNDVNLFKYVTAFFEKANRSQDIEAFLDFIISIDLLRDLSHNPLNLSYIASIYCSENGEEVLKSVQSTYDLNKEALKFIIDYHTEHKKIERSEFLRKFNECVAFISELEINLSFVYHQKDILDKNYKFAHTLSQLGIGRIERNRNNGKWSFYVINVSYQEIIAADYFGPLLSKNALLTLLDNPLYWHFTKLLIGYLVTNRGHYIITELLTDIYKKIAQEREFNFYLYFIVLSELPPDILNQQLKEKDIGTLIDLYESLYHDSLWSNLYFDCLVNIYRKLDEKYKSLFEKTTVDRINSKITIPGSIGKNGLTAKQINALVFPRFLTSIIERLRLFNSAIISKVILSQYLRLEELHTKHSKWIEKDIDRYNSLQHLADEELKDSAYSLLLLLYQIDNHDLLREHSDQLWVAYDRSNTHAALIIKIIALFTSSSIFINRFDHLGKSKKDVNIIQVLMCVGMAGAFDYHENIHQVKERLIKMKALLEHHAGSKARKDEFHRPDCSTYAMALTLTNDRELFPLLVWANCFESGALNVMQDISFQQANELLVLFFKEKERCKFSSLDFEELHATVGSMNTGALALENQYKDFYLFFKNYVKAHEKTLTNIAEHKTLDGFLNSPIAFGLYTCANTLYYPSAIKKFMNEIFSTVALMENKFIRYHFLPFLMSCSIPLYETKYHHFILSELFDEHEDTNVIIHLFSENQVLYWYESNLQFLAAFWRKFLPMIKKQGKNDFWKNKLSRILTIAYSSLKLKFNVTRKSYNDDLIQNLAELILLDKVKQYQYSDDVLYEEETMVNLAIYPLLTLYTDNKAFILDNKFLLIFNGLDEARKNKFFNELLQLSNFEIEVFRECISPAIWETLKIYCHKFNKKNSLDISKAFKANLNRNI